MLRPASAECRTTLTGKTAKNADDIKSMRARLWHEEGIAVIDPKDLYNDFDRQAVVNAATKMYGKRK